MKERELNKDKKKQYNIWLTDEERKLLNAKVQQYNYQYLSDYIRDAALYEGLIEVNVSYTDEVNALFQEAINEIRKYTKEVRRILKWSSNISKAELEQLQHSLNIIYGVTKSLKKSVNDNINVTEIVHNSRKKIYQQQFLQLLII